MPQELPKRQRALNKEKKSAGVKGAPKPAEYEYVDESVQDFDYADFVKIRSGVRGMLFSFGKIHPERAKHMLHTEILIPLDVALSLHQIMGRQFEELERQGVIKSVAEAGPEKQNGG